ncbi:MAG: hypothetical protein JWP91_784 [Fibrobacteres bacterium]|nr:hypothetical protein [Fibrobacterota bacterium]
MSQSNMSGIDSLPSEQKGLPQGAKETGVFSPLQAGSTQDRTHEAAYFTVESLAAYLDVPRRTIEKWAIARRLPGMVKAGRLLRFERTAIDRAALSGALLLPATHNRRVAPSVLQRSGNR